MTKGELRERMRLISRDITAKERALTAQKIFETLGELPQFQGAECVALYCNLKDEVPSEGWIKGLLERGVRVVVPRVEGDDMEFYPYDKESMLCGSYGIVEPQSTGIVATADIDVMIVPGVAFCDAGQRLGRGKGYYDRYLSRFDFRAYTIGVGFVHQLVNSLPIEPHDRTLDRVVTPLVNTPLPTLISRTLNSAWGDADRLGWGVDRLLSMGYSWVLLRFRILFSRTPDVDEPLSVETWVSECKSVISTRNFLLRDCLGEVVGEAVSQWCMIDVKRRRPVDLTRGECDYSQFASPRDGALTIGDKLAPIDESNDGVESRLHSVVEQDLDFNNHVNTIKYIEMMLSMLPHDQLLSRGASSADIQFIHESYLDERLTIRHLDCGNSTSCCSRFEILRPDGSLSLRAEFDICD